MSLDMLCIAYKKVVVLKFKIKFHQETKPSDVSSNYLKLLVRCSGFQRAYVSSCSKRSLLFITISMYDIMTTWQNS
jgi:hypothetical protein